MTPDPANLCRTGVISQIAANWGNGSVMGCNSDRVTVHYYGTITVPDTGVYNFRNIADDGFYMTINGQVAINDWRDKGCGGNVGASLTLSAGTAYTLDAWFYENGGGACSTLYVYQPSGNFQVVPSSWFGQQASTTYAKDPLLLPAVNDAANALKLAKDALNAIPTLVINPPTDLIGSIDGSIVNLSWAAPITGLLPERYAVSWTDGVGGWGVASVSTSLAINASIVASTAGWDKSYTFTIRSDQDTARMYSSWSNAVTLYLSAPAPVIVPVITPAPVETPTATVDTSTVLQPPTPSPSESQTPSTTGTDTQTVVSDQTPTNPPSSPSTPDSSTDSSLPPAVPPHETTPQDGSSSVAPTAPPVPGTDQPQGSNQGSTPQTSSSGTNLSGSSGSPVDSGTATAPITEPTPLPAPTSPSTFEPQTPTPPPALPNPIPVPVPDPTLSEVLPSVDNTNSDQSSQQPLPSPTPADPAPAPDANPTPAPEPAPEPSPDPAPNPQPDPAPAPEPPADPQPVPSNPEPEPAPTPAPVAPEPAPEPPVIVPGLVPNNPDSLPDDIPKEAPAEVLVPHVQEDKAGVENGGIEFFGTKTQPQVVGEDGKLTPPPPPPGSGLPIPPDAITLVDTFIGQPGGTTFNAPDVAVPVIETPVTGALAAVPGVQALNHAFVAMANIGNDMSPITRKKAKKILVLTTVIAAVRRRFGN